MPFLGQSKDALCNSPCSLFLCLLAGLDAKGTAVLEWHPFPITDWTAHKKESSNVRLLGTWGFFVVAPGTTYSDQLNEWMHDPRSITCYMSMGKPITKRTWHHLQEIQFELQLPLGGRAQSTHDDAHVLFSVDDCELLQNAEGGSPVALIIQKDLDEGNHAVVF